VFCHRFYAVHAHNAGDNDWHVVAPACLFLAGKVEETPKALRDVVIVSYLLKHRKEQEAAQERIKDKARRRRTT
jgi:cyclin T